ncbi:MAG: exodeoxyribonuclease V subunit alpha [Mycobacteriaceae bacterium]|nr:exodeoxyribonuclease V subunit alpha [Mycobacteriaceae bacterium]
MTATGLLRIFNEAAVLSFADVHVAQRLTALAGEHDESVALAVALLVRAVRDGSVCVDLGTVAADTGFPELPWPEPMSWLAAVSRSRLMANPPVLRLHDNRLLYLDRYWREEEQVCTDLLALSMRGVPTAVPDSARLFPPGYAEQRAAAEIAVAQSVTVLTGGPGTGKTTTVARLLALLAEQEELGGRPRPRIALAAPTGKAAARLGEAVSAEIAKLDAVDQRRLAGLAAMTLHRLLGPRPDASATSMRFRHHRGNRLPHNVIVVDETSMVALTMMARLLEAVRPDARLILVGDADQLVSVAAGAVLADLVDGLSTRSDRAVIALRQSHRFGESIGALAQAIRIGDADQAIALLRSGSTHIEWIDDDNPVESLRAVLVMHARRVREAALLGAWELALAALDEHRLLCAHRDGPAGVTQWNQQIQRWLSDETGHSGWSQWYPGRPVLVTANDYGLGVYNGDTGVVVVDPDHRPSLRIVISGATGPHTFSTTRLSNVETMYAMTIHKTQGSQAKEVTVVMPPPESRLLTRELLYTAVTRATDKIRLVGTEASVRAAVRRRVARATGLAKQLQAAPRTVPR